MFASDCVKLLTDLIEKHGDGELTLRVTKPDPAVEEPVEGVDQSHVVSVPANITFLKERLPNGKKVRSICIHD